MVGEAKKGSKYMGRGHYTISGRNESIFGQGNLSTI
jgi:hypothetical protein